MILPAPPANEPPDALLERARALESVGRWGDAAGVYSHLFHRAVRDRNVAAAADALRRGATARTRHGLAAEAEDLADLSFEVAERCGLKQAAARALNVRANLRFTLGDYAGAAELYRAALDRARAMRDDELVGLACQNLGVVANIHGELEEARCWYLESVASSIRSGDRGAAMLVYNNLGMLCSDLREWLEAELYFDRGIEIARRLGDRVMLAKLYSNSAEPLIHMGELTRAARTLDRAGEIAEPLGDAGTIVLVARYRAVLARLAGDFPAADAHLSRAAVFAEAEGLELERAEILGALARLRWEQGRRDDARTAALAARERFLALGAAREIRRLDDVLTEWA